MNLELRGKVRTLGNADGIRIPTATETMKMMWL